MEINTNFLSLDTYKSIVQDLTEGLDSFDPNLEEELRNEIFNENQLINELEEKNKVLKHSLDTFIDVSAGIVQDDTIADKKLTDFIIEKSWHTYHQNYGKTSDILLTILACLGDKNSAIKKYSELNNLKIEIAKEDIDMMVDEVMHPPSERSETRDEVDMEGKKEYIFDYLQAQTGSKDSVNLPQKSNEIRREDTEDDPYADFVESRGDKV